MKNTVKTTNRKLKALFVDRGIRVPDVAKALGLSTPSVYVKLRGDSEFTYSEIKAIKELLALTPEEFTAAFPF